MRLHVSAFSLTAGLVWGTALFLVAAAHFLWPNYGQAFLEFTEKLVGHP